MKKTLLLLSLPFWFSAVVAQNFNYDTTTTITVEGDADGLYELVINFIPTDSSNITFKWKTLENTLSSYWSYSLCDYNNCYTDIPDSAKMAPLTLAKYQDGVTGFFRLLVNTDDTARQGVLKLWLYDSANVAMADTITFILITHEVIDTTDTTGTTGLNVLQANSFHLFPNPSSDLVTVYGFDFVELELLNILGERLQSFTNITNQSVQLNMTDFPLGTYFVRCLGADGQYRTKTLIRN